jgi:C-terminal processing protease CtpA/Prc
MKIVKKIFAFLLLLIIVFSCDICPADSEEAAKKNINNWILDNMKVYYFWNEKIPSKTDKSLDAKDYFNSLLYKTEDRFSWIQEDYTDLLDLLSGIEMEAGYDYTLMRISQNSQDLLGIINYVKLNSPASQTDLKRGDLFSTINDKKLTIDNYKSVLGALSSPHTLGIIDRNHGFDPVKTISLSVTRFAENPVLLDTVYNISGKKIGYLFYNFFAEDSGDKTNKYIKELNTIFGKIKATGIDELIIDFRYNSGGSLTTCSEFSSMISNRKKSEVFCLVQYNSILDQAFKKQEGADYNKIYFADNIERRDADGKVIESVAINKLTNLNRLYVITSSGTASASEVLINGLKAYMDVILIGDVTYGKNVGSITLYEEDAEKQKKNKWGMQPIVVKLANSKGSADFGDGFKPDVEESEYKYPLLPLGEINETLLQTALVKMGVVDAQAGLRAEKGNTFIPVFSSIDRTPVRRNTYISHIK